MLRFGRGAIDVAARRVEFDNELQHLEPQAFDLLAYLVEHRDRVVPKIELLDEVWGDQFVSESALTTRIKEVRRSLGDDGVRQSVVKNFRGRGYRFVAVADEHGSTARNRPPVTVALSTSLLGRDHDIEATLRLLDTSKLVTLVGPGGVGKTSLARDVALRQRDHHIDGVAVVRLAAIRDPEAIMHVLRRDAGLDECGPDPADLIAAIADLDALIVFDNCEHVIDEISRLIAAITAVDGRVRFLATSRERLGLPGEQVWPVAPLDSKTARQLLFERVRSIQPTYAWPVGSEESVTKLLNTLDRLPLAIEMAAARLPTIGVDDLAELLANRLELLRSADRTADQRHRTINSLIEWSEDLLDEQGRDLLTVLSAFAGAVPAIDLGAVSGIDAAELSVGALASLVDQSLVVANTVQQPTTYRLLETVRARAVQRRSAQLESRHANHVIDVVSAMDQLLRTPDERLAARRLDTFGSEIRLAHKWARDNDPKRAAELTTSLLQYALERQWTEPASWAESLAELIDPDEPAALAAAAALAADHANRGNYEVAKRLAEQAVASDDNRIAGSAFDTLANIGMYTGALETAVLHGTALRLLGEQHLDSTARTAGLLAELLPLAWGGRAEEALQRLLNDVDPVPQSPSSSAWNCYAHGEVLAALGREREAIEEFENAIEQGTSVGSRFVVSVAQVSTLAARTREGDLQEARAAFVPILSHYRRIRSLTHGITALRNLVELLVRAREDQTALVILGALSTPDVKATYGVESQRLDQARATVASRVDPETASTWIEQGAAHDPLWALDHAISVLS